MNNENKIVCFRCKSSKKQGLDLTCFHYTNLRPCWNEEQWNKNSWYDGKYVRKNNA